MNAATKTAKSTNQTSTENTVRDALIVEHLPLVTAIAAHVQRSIPVHTELNDLVHAGVMGLFDAATKYQDDKQVAFPTYAKHRIKGAILDSLRQSDWASRDIRKRHKQMETLTRDLTAKLGRTPTQDELADAMGLSSQRWQSLMVDFRNLALAASRLRARDGEDQPLNDTPAAPADRPDKIFARSEMRERLSSVMKTLPERYQQVVTLYYDRDLTMKEIAGIMKIKESRVSQIHYSALQRMQSSLTASGIQSSAAF